MSTVTPGLVIGAAGTVFCGAVLYYYFSVPTAKTDQNSDVNTYDDETTGEKKTRETRIVDPASKQRECPWNTSADLSASGKRLSYDAYDGAYRCQLGIVGNGVTDTAYAAANAAMDASTSTSYKTQALHLNETLQPKVCRSLWQWMSDLKMDTSYMEFEQGGVDCVLHFAGKDGAVFSRSAPGADTTVAMYWNPKNYVRGALRTS